jgi:hypothetical protein
VPSRRHWLIALLTTVVLVLAYLATRGFGFSLLAGPHVFLDAGEVQVLGYGHSWFNGAETLTIYIRPENFDGGSLRPLARELFERYRPSLEDAGISHVAVLEKVRRSYGIVHISTADGASFDRTGAVWFERGGPTPRPPALPLPTTTIPGRFDGGEH